MATKRRLSGTMATIAIPAAALTAPMVLVSNAHAQAPTTAGAELRILSPDPMQPISSNSFELSVSFKSRAKSPVMTAELWVDGVRWVRRDLDTPQTRNVLSFDVDSSTLPEGLHTFLIKTICADGSVSQADLKSQIVRQNPLEEAVGTGNGMGPELAFSTPLSGKHVSGNVEIAVEAKPRAGVNPYVTFYVDKQFKTLKNYPPYSYAWDSTAVPNGFHVIEATGYLDSTNATTTRKMKVWVDNAGGNTVRQSDIPDLSRKTVKDTSSITLTHKAVKKAVKTPLTNVKPVVTTVTPSTDAAPLTVTSQVPQPKVTVAPVAPADITPRTVARPATPRSVKAPRLSASNVQALASEMTVVPPVKTTVGGSLKALPRPTVTHAAPTARTTASTKSLTMTPVAPVAASSTRTTGAVELPLVPPPAPRATTARIVGIAAPTKVATPVVVHRAAFSARAPRPAAPMVPLATPVRRTAKATPRPLMRPQSSSVLDMMQMSRLEGKTFQVAFDGTRIAFDVQPRVEAGLPIAPFRQIFEHTGGQVMWVKETQIVRAVNADREIVIKVGGKTAVVNGRSMSMDRAATIEHGRTIVPLNFVGRALDVDVKYDQTTGRLQITSKH